MTVSTENSRDTFTFDGVTTVFPFTFRINDEDKSNIKLYEDGVLMSASLYTIAVNANGVGGTITFSSAPGAVSPDNTVGVAIRQLPYTQGFDIRDGEGFDEEAVENAFDKNTILTQQLKDLIARSLSLPLASSVSPNVDAPSTDKQVMYYDLATETIKWTTVEALYAASGAGNGDIVCSSPSVVDSNLVSFDGTTGNIVKDSGITVPATAGKALFPVRVNSGASGLEYHDQAASELTIASGAIVPTGNWHTVDNESNASADDLTDITATNLPAGALLYLTAENSGRVPTVKHNASKIDLWDDTDVDLAVDNVLILVHQGSNVWRQIGLISNGASGGAGSPIGAALAPMTVATLYTQAHGLGYAPKDYYMLATCTTADLGYSVGETIRIPSVAVNWHPTVGPYYYGLVMSADATNLYVKTAATYGPMILNKSTGGVSNMTLGSWSFQRYLVG